MAHPPTSDHPTITDPAPRTRRSVFGNYAPVAAGESDEVGALETMPAGASEAREAADLAWSRSFFHQFLARAFEYPSAQTWQWLCDAGVRTAFQSALEVLDPEEQGELRASGFAALEAMCAEKFGQFHDEYITAVGHAARGSCPINEIEYGDLKADPLFQPHRLADLAAFYRVFGLELGPDAGERQDHLCVELEFMAVLTAQEADLLLKTPSSEALAVCRDAQRKFLREHLGRWLPSFGRRLIRSLGDGPLSTFARLAIAFIEQECARMNIERGGEELLLRPADEGGSLCDRCGLTQALPGGTPDEGEVGRVAAEGP